MCLLVLFTKSVSFWKPRFWTDKIRKYWPPPIIFYLLKLNATENSFLAIYHWQKNAHLALCLFISYLFWFYILTCAGGWVWVWVSGVVCAYCSMDVEIRGQPVGIYSIFLSGPRDQTQVVNLVANTLTHWAILWLSYLWILIEILLH